MPSAEAERTAEVVQKPDRPAVETSEAIFLKRWAPTLICAIFRQCRRLVRKGGFEPPLDCSN